LKDPGVDGRIILKLIFERLVGGGGIEWINLVQDRDRWQQAPSGSIKYGEFLE
jgi:hypothetical protein